MNGFTQGGYKLVYTDKPIAWREKELAKRGVADFSTSLGFSVGSFGGRGGAGESGAIGNVFWGSPAFKAGITPEMVLVSVNGTAYTANVLKDAILAAEKDKQPLQLQFRKDNRYCDCYTLLRRNAVSVGRTRRRHAGPPRRNPGTEQEPIACDVNFPCRDSRISAAAWTTNS